MNFIMCGRFNFSDGELEEIRQILLEVNDRLYGPVKTGEVYPTNVAAVLTRGMKPEPMIWGFPHFKGSGVIINAKAETALEKRLFRASMLERRCIIPSSGFYEWGEAQQSLFDTPKRGCADKTKYLFHLPGTRLLYMAGLWNSFREADGAEKRRFVILTTAANAGIRDIHDRMPVILRPEECGGWLSPGGDFEALLVRGDVLLEREIA